MNKANFPQFARLGKAATFSRTSKPLFESEVWNNTEKQQSFYSKNYWWNMKVSLAVTLRNKATAKAESEVECDWVKTENTCVNCSVLECHARLDCEDNELPAEIQDPNSESEDTNITVHVAVPTLAEQQHWWKTGIHDFTPAKRASSQNKHTLVWSSLVLG